MSANQAPAAVMMVRPQYFGYNQETADSNSFQQAAGKENVGEIKVRALSEFDGLVLTLKTSGVEVIEFQTDNGPESPDAIFPNNWVSFHPDGKVIVYPMMAESRRLERKMEFITALEKHYDFEISEIIDLSHYEAEGHFLESTGSLVMDYNNKILYANHSPRTSSMLVNKVAEILGYEVCQFHAIADGQDVYHTNVLMCVGERLAVVCLDALKNPQERADLEESLSGNGKQIIAITIDQMNHFAGNMIELKSDQGAVVLAMSQSAYRSLSGEQIQALQGYGELVYPPIHTIEKYGGGSVRCMLAGIFLPKVSKGEQQRI